MIEIDTKDLENYQPPVVGRDVVAAMVAEDAKAEWDAIEGYQKRLNRITEELSMDDDNATLQQITSMYREHMSDELKHAKDLHGLFETLTKDKDATS